MLDRLPVERERGITVKAQTAALPYKGYLLNLIDTPGHVDFSAEVSRSLAVCDGIILLIAANQGVQAQTIANFWLAFERNITMLPMINKIDLSGANITKVEAQLKTLFEFDPDESLKISAKSGFNVDKIFDIIIDRIPPPNCLREAPFKAFIFDSLFDHFRGAIAFVLVKEGGVRKGQKIRSFHNGKEYDVSEVGVMRPDMTPCTALYAGQVGYIICNMRTVKESAVGETLFTGESESTICPFPGFKSVKPTIYAGLFPLESVDYENLKQAVERLCLNDPSVVISPESSPALGLGWRVGFLGILHMEVFGARLDQEYGASVILSQPSVEYKAIVKVHRRIFADNATIRKKRYNGQSEIYIVDASRFPDEYDIEKFLEPMVKVRIVVPSELMGAVNGLCVESRGERGDINSIDEDRLMINWRLPLAEDIYLVNLIVVVDFFERLKRLTSGYASFDYEHDGYNETQLIKLSITINGKEYYCFVYVEKLRQLLACVGSSTKPLSQITIQPMKRDFTQLLKGNFGGGGADDHLVLYFCNLSLLMRRHCVHGYNIIISLLMLEDTVVKDNLRRDLLFMCLVGGLHNGPDSQSKDKLFGHGITPIPELDEGYLKLTCNYS
uniref:Tr-type G domain-containing protein n=1 Tax=Heterorhabditis bacteriophora TaxID=37862 RepID=A0A1I7X8Y4_HETBA